MSKKLGYKPAKARKDDMGGYSTSPHTKEAPKGKKVGMDRKLKQMAKRIMNHE